MKHVIQVTVTLEVNHACGVTLAEASQAVCGRITAFLYPGGIDVVSATADAYGDRAPVETEDAAEHERDRQRELDENTHEYNERLANGQNVY